MVITKVFALLFAWLAAVFEPATVHQESAFSCFVYVRLHRLSLICGMHRRYSKEICPRAGSLGELLRGRCTDGVQDRDDVVSPGNVGISRTREGFLV